MAAGEVDVAAEQEERQKPVGLEKGPTGEAVNRITAFAQVVRCGLQQIDAFVLFIICR